MTPELRRAMARYEEARFLYRKAVLASLNGTADGQAIRQAIRAVQSTQAELNRLAGPPRDARVEPRREPRATPSGLWPRRWGFASN
jgi:hypothetical protein